MNEWRIGDLKVTRIVDSEELWKGTILIPEMTAENILKEGWLVPRFADEKGKIHISFHSLVVESGGLKILIDTCIGDDKPRDYMPAWNLKHGGYLSDLAKAGYPRESIDRVICTHLHIDHVGWNTMLENGRWVPTFPNARYLLSRKEWEHWSQTTDAGIRQVMEDSVRPIVAAEMVDWVEGGQTVTNAVSTESTPGHSPGHMSVRLESRGQLAIVSGDLMHHPIQCAHPEWKGAFDFDWQQACATRRSFLERCAQNRATVFGTHFAAPSAGRVVKFADAFRFEM